MVYHVTIAVQNNVDILLIISYTIFAAVVITYVNNTRVEQIYHILSVWSKQNELHTAAQRLVSCYRQIRRHGNSREINSS